MKRVKRELKLKSKLFQDRSMQENSDLINSQLVQKEMVYSQSQSVKEIEAIPTSEQVGGSTELTEDEAEEIKEQSNISQNPQAEAVDNPNSVQLQQSSTNVKKFHDVFRQENCFTTTQQETKSLQGLKGKNFQVHKQLTEFQHILVMKYDKGKANIFYRSPPRTFFCSTRFYRPDKNEVKHEIHSILQSTAIKINETNQAARIKASALIISLIEKFNEFGKFLCSIHKEEVKLNLNEFNLQLIESFSPQLLEKFMEALEIDFEKIKSTKFDLRQEIYQQIIISFELKSSQSRRALKAILSLVSDEQLKKLNFHGYLSLLRIKFAQKDCYKLIVNNFLVFDKEAKGMIEIADLIPIFDSMNNANMKALGLKLLGVDESFSQESLKLMIAPVQCPDQRIREYKTAADKGLIDYNMFTLLIMNQCIPEELRDDQGILDDKA